MAVLGHGFEEKLCLVQGCSKGRCPLFFRKAYEDLGEEYSFIREMLAARVKSGLTQEAVAQLMGTTKSAVSRLESAGRHAPSLTTLKKYAQAVDCRLEIKLVPKSRPAHHAAERAKKQIAG